MGFAKSGQSIWNKRQWQRRAQEERAERGHVWEWDPEARIMRCYKCGSVRLPTDADKIVTRTENGDTDF